MSTMIENRGRKQRVLQQLKLSLDAEAFLADVVGARNIVRERDELIHSCPLPFGLHKTGDTRPSASLNRDSLLFNCFVCGGGDIFWLIQNVLDVSMRDAVDMMSGHLRPREMTAQEFLAEIESYWQVEEFSFSLPSYSPRILEPWKMYSPYLVKRGISTDVQREFLTGVDLNHKERFEGKEVQDWVVTPRIVIPHFYQGALRGWQKRKIEDSQLGPKYRNSHGFPKEYTLYNFDRVNKSNPVVVVESVTSVMRLHGVGHTNSVATFGAKLAPDQKKLLRQFDQVYLFMDNDEDGHRATEEIIEEVSPYTKVWVVENNVPGTDPANFTDEDLAKMVLRKIPGTYFSTWRSHDNSKNNKGLD